jgi:hypothetical protein
LKTESYRSSFAYSIVQTIEPHYRVASLTSSREKGSSDRSSLTPLLTALQGQLLASNYDQARLLRNSFGAVAPHNRIASPTSSSEKGSRDGKFRKRLMTGRAQTPTKRDLPVSLSGWSSHAIDYLARQVPGGGKSPETESYRLH